MRNYGKYWISGLIGWIILSGFTFAQQAEVQSILVFGLKKTKQVVVLREMTFGVGDSLMTGAAEMKETIRKNYNNIYNTGLFTKVEIDEELTENGLVFRITVQERWYFWPSPYVSLEERTFNEWWQDKDLDRLVYGLGLEWANFTGWNDQVVAYGQLGYSRRLTLSYNRPFIFPKAKMNGSFLFSYLNNKEIGYGTEKGVLQLARLQNEPMRISFSGLVRLGKRFSPRKHLYIDAMYNHFKPNDSIVFFNDRYLTTRSTREYYPSVALSYINDQRDLRTFPLDGYKYGAIVRHSGFPGISSTTFTRLTLSFSHHIPLSKRWNIAYGSQNMILIGKRVPYFDKFFVGFTNTLRGFEPYVIDGSFINMTKGELKFAIIPRKMIHIEKIPFAKFRDFPLGIYISAFADAGYVKDDTFNNSDNYLKNTTLLGYGVGLNLITIYDYLLRVEYSFNNLGGRGIFLHGTVSIR